ncbi:MAG: hypothetical protein NZZ41_00345 [Candidatus Dojkabacteria bacterium]|nr:hypothetical protein [Candidatus Dojkabacteria bacterium]
MIQKILKSGDLSLLTSLENDYILKQEKVDFKELNNYQKKFSFYGTIYKDRILKISSSVENYQENILKNGYIRNISCFFKTLLMMKEIFDKEKYIRGKLFDTIKDMEVISIKTKNGKPISFQEEKIIKYFDIIDDLNEKYKTISYGNFLYVNSIHEYSLNTFDKSKNYHQHYWFILLKILLEMLNIENIKSKTVYLIFSEEEFNNKDKIKQIKRIFIDNLQKNEKKFISIYGNKMFLFIANSDNANILLKMIHYEKGFVIEKIDKNYIKDIYELIK